MEVLFLLPLLLFLGLIIFQLFSSNEEVVLHRPQGHGHRCFSEGLSIPERRIVNILTRNLSHNDYFIFNNIILPSIINVTTQIDHIVISRFGIFVIESKDTRAWIFGSATSDQWTCTYPPHGKKFKMSNPLRQNYGHVQVLKQLMPFAEEHFYNIVVFTNDAQFKTDRIEGVVYENELADFILKQDKTKLSPQRLLMAIGKLSYLCQTTEFTLEDHIKHLEQKQAKIKTAVA